jgi:choline dehydrogenase-like flavoprotein
MTDAVVVGSGPGGVHAAAALLEAGRSVLMLDFGRTDDRYAPLVPKTEFTTTRRTDERQHRYFLGDDFEGIPFGSVRVGAQLTPPRQYVVEGDPRLSATSDGFAAVQSLARGGLAAGWGAGVFPFSNDELGPMGLTLAEMQPHYDTIVRRIGVAAEADDLSSFFPDSPDTMPGIELDSTAEVVFEAYQRRRVALNARGFHLGRARLAVATRRHCGRGPESYRDMAYWADLDRSVYRPQWTLEELEHNSRFTYLPNRLVHRFQEDEMGVTIEATTRSGGLTEEHRARTVVLAAGTLGTSRIPILCNPYSYVPTVNLRALGGSVRDRRSSLAQLTAMMRTHDGSGRLLQAQVFSYRSLLTFKLMKEIPLDSRASLAALRVMMPYFTILGIHHEDRPAPGKRMLLRRTPVGGEDVLDVRYQPDRAEQRRQRADERRMLRFFLGLGCLPLKVVRPGHGANMHYAGALPMAPDGGDLTCDRTGRLRPTRAVYVADGSVFPWLPPKGLTFNLMAHADRLGTLLGRKLA